MNDALDPISHEVPDKPSIDGLEERWMTHWDKEKVYRFDRDATARVGLLHRHAAAHRVGLVARGHIFSFTHPDIVARFWRMRGKDVFFPMGWDDNGLPTERRVENYYGVRCEPSLPYDPPSRRPRSPARRRSPSRAGTSSNCACRSPRSMKRSSRTSFATSA
jgi:valyl-tRNA synthetase